MLRICSASKLEQVLITLIMYFSILAQLHLFPSKKLLDRFLLFNNQHIWTLSDFDAHDCYMMVTVVLLVAIRVNKPAYVKVVIMPMCYFFNQISRKKIDTDEFVDLKKFMRETRGVPVV